MSFLCSFILNSVKLLVTRYGSIVSVQNRLISHLCIRLFSHRWFVACFCFRKCSCSSSSVGFVSFIKLNRQIRISVTSFFVALYFWDKKQSILRTMVHPKHDEKIWYVQCSCLSFVRFCSFFLSVYFFLRKYFLICDITGLLCSQMTPRISFFLTSLMAIVYLNESKFPPH